MPADSELLYCIAMTRIPQVGAITARQLISYAGSPEAVFKLQKGQLTRIPGVGNKIGNFIRSKKPLIEAEKEMRLLERNGIRAFFYLQADYPIRLKQIPDAPILIYHKGNADLNAHRMVGIVGTRRPSHHGTLLCEQLVEDLEPFQVSIVSGLAYGIDITAHRSALLRSLPTVAVLGCGLDNIYPPGHRKAAVEMLNCGGLVTEFSIGTKLEREHFPMRNRIIAGLCDALVVVESDIKGGSMITAQLANSYHRDVFSFPGRIGDPLHRGCHYLIKTNLAALIESGEELATNMQWNLKGPKTIQRQMFQELADEEKQIMTILQPGEPTNIDKIYRSVSLPVSAVAAILLELEFKGVIKTLPGKMFLRL